MGGKTESPRSLGAPPYYVAQWTVFTIIRDAFKLSLRPPLPLIQFSVILPSTIFGLYQYINISSIFNPNYVSLLSQREEVQAPSMSLAILLIQVILSPFISSLVIGVVLYAAVGIHQGKNLPFFEVIRAVLPLWRNIFITTLVYLMFSMVINGVQIGLTLGVSASVNYLPMYLLVFVLLAMTFVSLILQPTIGIMYSVASGVSCFEEQNYGIAAFKRTKKLLHRKWRSAVGLFILLSVAATPMGLVVREFSKQKLTPDQWFESTRVLLMTFYAVFGSYLAEFHHICWVLFYLGCVADSDHEEYSILHSEDRLEGGYDSLPAASSG